MKVNIVSFSGGRTSAFMVHQIEQMRATGQIKGQVEYIFLDTGAEHPGTYEFIRKVAGHFNIQITLLRPVISPDIGTGVTFKVIGWDDLKPDLQPWREMLAKHGAPYSPGGGFCTGRLKTTAHDKYCDEKYGKGNTVKWIGYRIDESKRAWGAKVYPELAKRGYDSFTAAELMAACLRESDHAAFLAPLFDSQIDLFGCSPEVSILPLLVKKVDAVKKIGFRFLFEISEFEKSDILDFWKQQSFDLEISEWSGNCVFCIKKGENKVALAIKDNPEMAQEFIDMVNEPTVRDMGRKFPVNAMYRDYMALEQIRDKWADVDRADIIASLRGAKRFESGSCSESCEAYSDLFELLEEVA